MISREYWKERGVIPRWELLLVYILIVVAGLIGFVSTQRLIDSNCKAIHKIVEQGAQLMDTRPGSVFRSNLDESLHRGFITRSQYFLYLHQAQGNLRVWRSADCTR